MSIPPVAPSTGTRSFLFRDLSTFLEQDISAHVCLGSDAVRQVMSRVGTQNGFVLSDLGACLLLPYATSRRLPLLRNNSVVGVRLRGREVGFGDYFSEAYVLASSEAVSSQLRDVSVHDVSFIPYEVSARAMLGLEGTYPR